MCRRVFMESGVQDTAAYVPVHNCDKCDFGEGLVIGLLRTLRLNVSEQMGGVRT